jgi:hypothetical protein
MSMIADEIHEDVHNFIAKLIALIGSNEPTVRNNNLS